MSMFQVMVDFTVVTDIEDKELIKTMIYALIDDIEKEVNSKNVIYNNRPPCKCKLKRCDLKIGEEERKIIHDSFWEQDNFARRWCVVYPTLY